MTGIEAAATSRVLESNLKDLFKGQNTDKYEAEDFEAPVETQQARSPEQSGQILDTIA